MKTYQIQLKEIQSVKDFNTTICSFPEDVDLKNGRYSVDAKSIMGIFSLDLSSTLDCVVHGDDANTYQEKLKPFLV